MCVCVCVCVCVHVCVCVYIHTYIYYRSRGRHEHNGIILKNLAILLLQSQKRDGVQMPFKVRRHANGHTARGLSQVKQSMVTYSEQ